MRRRDFIKGIAGSALPANSADAMRRVGWLDIFRQDNPFAQGRVEAVREDLAKAGWTVGRNLQIDYRWGVTTPELAQLAERRASELVPRCDPVFTGREVADAGAGHGQGADRIPFRC